MPHFYGTGFQEVAPGRHVKKEIFDLQIRPCHALARLLNDHLRAFDGALLTSADDVIVPLQCETLAHRGV
ncbi:MAG: hypothetical protein AAB316_07985, partial [Bacteroidota bacterium]